MSKEVWISKAKSLEELPTKQRVFLVEYLRSWNATKAAAHAGYSFPGVRGSQLVEAFRKSGLLDAEFRKMQISPDQIRARFAELANFDVNDLLVHKRDGTVALDLKKMKKFGNLLQIEANNKGEVKVKSHDQTSALSSLAKMAGLFTDQVELSGGSVPVAFTTNLKPEDLESVAPKKEGAE